MRVKHYATEKACLDVDKQEVRRKERYKKYLRWLTAIHNKKPPTDGNPIGGKTNKLN